MNQPRTTDQAWAAQRVAALPARWQGRLLGAWERERKQRTPGHWTEEQAAQKRANLALLKITEQLQTLRSLPLDAEDLHVCQVADQLADKCMGSGQLWGGQFGFDVRHIRQAMARICEAHGVQPPAYRWLLDREGTGAHIEDRPAIARMTDALWWRRQLRKMHAKNVEGAAITLGLVNKRRDIYVSTESLARRQQQNRRNAATLENTIARNEAGQEFTLAELAAKGSANKAIRRAELMTRISGFERIARDLGHAGLFFTITCPSRMHKWRTVKGGNVIENPKFDGTTPREAQAYLAKVWGRIRASLKRQGVGLYGFRIAEPNHDGTPHWHLLTFHQAEHFADLQATIWRYALADSPTERGADRHRVDFKPIDWERGSAAGYIAKYVAKNIDGYKVDQDLYGNDALETSARVEAWAATWGIRQFQQVGGPPVGPWRELRRVAEVPDQAPDHLKAAHAAVNKTAVIEGRENASVAWDRYCKAQGGVFCGRSYRIRISTEEQTGFGRYGEPLGARPVGVETTNIETYTPAHMTWMNPPGRATRVVHWFLESARHVWEIVGRAGSAARGLFKGAKRPWTRVNNCTEGINHDTEREARKRDFEGARALGWGTGPHQIDGSGLRGAFA